MKLVTIVASLMLLGLNIQAEEAAAPAAEKAPVVKVEKKPTPAPQKPTTK